MMLWFGDCDLMLTTDIKLKHRLAMQDQSDRMFHSQSETLKNCVWSYCVWSYALCSYKT